MEYIGSLIVRLYTKKCTDPVCSADGGYHTAHLTWLGRLRYLGHL